MSFHRAVSLGVALVALLAVAMPPALALPPPDPGAAPSPGPGPYVPRGPILIASNAQFSAANGVRSGSGTCADPFVISGWHITPSNGQVGIEIRGTTFAYRIDGNLVDAGSSTATGVKLVGNQGCGVVRNNYVYHRATGVLVQNEDPLVVANTIVGTAKPIPTGTGVSLVASNAHLERNLLYNLDTGVRAYTASPTFLENGVHTVANGFVLDHVDRSTLHGDFLSLATKAAIVLDAPAQVTATALVIQKAEIGVHQIGGSFTLVDTRLFDANTGVLGSNGVLDARTNRIDGGVTGFDLTNHNAKLLQNQLHDLERTAIVLKGATGGMVEANTLRRNGGGIDLQTTSIVPLANNQLTDNAWGLSIPYAARQNIPYLTGNWVNGVNVDGSIVPTDRVYYFRTANVTIVNDVRDSGFNAGYYGSLTLDGGAVFYEVDTAHVIGSTFRGHVVGVHAVNTFNLVVSGSTLVNNRVGVRVEQVAVPHLVPLSVASVKDSTFNWQLDPAFTYGVHVSGDTWTSVTDSTFANWDTAVWFEKQVIGEISGNEVRANHVGLRLDGSATQQPWDVAVRDNTIHSNVDGIYANAFHGTIQANAIDDNHRAGVRLVAAAPLVHDNTLSGNGFGLLDALPCANMNKACSDGRYVNNTVEDSTHVGVWLNGTVTFNLNRILRSGSTGLVLSRDTTLLDNTIAESGGAGAILTGTYASRGNVFEGNAGDGLRLYGNLASRQDRFVGNLDAGIHFRGVLLDMLEGEVSNNFDGILVDRVLPSVVLPPVSIPSITQPGTPIVGFREDPVYVHLTDFVGNARNAIRAPIEVEVNATYNYWGRADGPRVNVLDQVGAFGNSVTVGTRFVPWYTNPSHAITAPVDGL